MQARRLLAAAFVAASLAPVAALAQNAAPDDQTPPPARSQPHNDQGKPDSAKAPQTKDHAKPVATKHEHAQPMSKETDVKPAKPTAATAPTPIGTTGTPAN